jgi:DNA adenine methylase
MIRSIRMAQPAPDLDARTRVRPLLKWAGGKRQLLPELRRFVPRDFRDYHEPFFGSGALFFDLKRSGRLTHRRAILVDDNRDLIGCYKAVAENLEGVIDHLSQLAAGHARSGESHYYRVRDQLFNPRRRELLAAHRTEPYPADLAAMFIYLNRTGFNGLFRLNSGGGFNVPAGRYANPRICDEPTLRAVSTALRDPGVEIRHDNFESILRSAGAADFVYFDPPYAPLTATARFTSYTAPGFDDDDQRRLRDVVLELAGRNCYVVVSNSTAPIIAELYEQDGAARRAGLRAHRVPARRAINSDATRRGDVTEFIVSNVAPPG